MHTNIIQLEQLKTYFFINSSWNKLPAEIAGAKTLSHFNSKLSELF